MAVLREAGWHGPWDVEIFGDPERARLVLVARRSDEAARRAPTIAGSLERPAP